MGDCQKVKHIRQQAPPLCKLLQTSPTNGFFSSSNHRRSFPHIPQTFQNHKFKAPLVRLWTSLLRATTEGSRMIASPMQYRIMNIPPYGDMCRLAIGPSGRLTNGPNYCPYNEIHIRQISEKPYCNRCDDNSFPGENHPIHQIIDDSFKPPPECNIMEEYFMYLDIAAWAQVAQSLYREGRVLEAHAARYLSLTASELPINNELIFGEDA